jgi:hypothetical protein
MGRFTVDVWLTEAWREEAVAWLDERLRAAGIARTGEVDQPRVRPWGTVLTAPTSGGRVWLKAPGADTVFEVALYGLLQRVAPQWILPPIAVDPARGWVLLPDGGPPLGEGLDSAELVDTLVAVFPAYGQLQRELMPRVPSLLSVGVVDMRASVMPKRFDEAVAAVGDYVARHDEEKETYRRVLGMRDRFVGWCERLTQASVAPSLDHNDLHPWNIFMVNRTPRFYDWGDSVVAHPFASMLVGLGILRASEDAIEVRRVRDAYLEAFTDLAPRAELVAELELAVRVSKVARALVWQRALSDQPGEFASAPLKHLAALDNGWLSVGRDY